MRFGAQFWRFDWPGGPAGIAGRLAESAAILDAGGAESLWLMDHFFQMDGVDGASADDPMLEGYTTLGFLAGHTRRARLGLLVTGVMYRHPAVLAKTVTTLDVLSGGRASLGIGASWYEREAVGLGLPFPTAGERLEHLEETLEVLGRMWGDGVAPYEGRHHRLAEPLNSPQPLSRPRPPVLVGGGGERRTLRLVARYADACNLFPQGPDVVAHKLDVLRAHCDAEGRDYDAIAKTLYHAPANTDADRIHAEVAPYAAVGIDTVYLGVPGEPVASAEAIVERVAPRLAEL